MIENIYEFKKEYPLISIITPVYNQETIIYNNLKSIFKNMNENFEMIIILDFCFDNTEKIVMSFIKDIENKKYIYENLIKIYLIINNNSPLFETKCSNIGLKNHLENIY